MLKTRKRWVSLLVAVAMIAALLVPFAGTASAAATYSVSAVTPVTAGTVATPNTYLTVTIDTATASVAGGSTVFLDLPSSPSGYAWTLSPGVANAAVVVTGAIAKADLTFTKSGQTYKIALANASAGGTSTTSSFSVPFTSLTVPGGASGDIGVTASAPGGSIFANGTLVVATAATGAVTLAAESSPSLSSGGGAIGVIDIKESIPGSLVNSTGSALKLTLPAGYTWTGPAVGALPAPVWGAFAVPASATVSSITANGGRELDISVTLAAASTSATGAVFVKLAPSIAIDETVAKLGDVTVTVSGDSTVSPSSLVVAGYGTYSVAAKALENPTIVAGKVGSTIGKFQITEGIGGSLIAGRTITLALPTNIVWSQYPVVDTANSTLNGLTLGAWAPVGSDGTTIKASVTGASAAGTGATVVFKSIQVTPAVDFSGNVDVTVGGSEGLTGTLTLGKVAAGITAAVSTSPDVKIGLAAQATGDLTISEVAAGNIDSLQNFAVLGATYLTRTGTGSQATITVNAPDGVAFAATPTVTVTAGDLQLGTVTSDTGIVTIPIKSNSVTASTIKVSGIQITLDRTVPEGPVVFKIKGTGVNETTQGTLILAAGESVLFPNSATAAKVAAANVITPAPGESTGTAVFKIGATSYTLNGASATLDAAPYIKNGRTLLPVRAIANAVGVSDDNIIWDPAGKVTIIKGDRVVQLTIGSNVLLVNGAAITIEVAPEITAGRTFLPLRALAQALSASIAWDATAQTVTVTF